MDTLSIIQPGTAVRIHGNIEGVVLQVIINPNNHVQYQVRYWDGNTAHDDTFEGSYEVEAIDRSRTQTIGFLGV